MDQFRVCLFVVCTHIPGDSQSNRALLHMQRQIGPRQTGEKWRESFAQMDPVRILDRRENPYQANTSISRQLMADILHSIRKNHLEIVTIRQET